MNTNKDPKTGQFLPRALGPDEEAPDPLDLARAESEGLPSAQPVSGEPSLAQALMAIAEAMKTIKASDAGASAKLEGIERFLLNQESTRPHENLFNPPLISDYNPLGERDHPRPELKCKMIWVGYQLSKECCTAEEIALLNRLQPGSYRVTKSDGRSIPFTVTATFTEAGNMDKLLVHYPCKHTEDRQNHMSMSAYLREALGEESTEVVQLHALQAQVAALKTQLGQKAA